MAKHRDKNDPEFLDRLGAEVHEFPSIRLDGEEGDLREQNSAQDLITGLMREAVDHYVENLEPEQVLATDYYYGRPFGGEERGRSQVVSTDVRDATQAQIPDLMGIFMGSDDVVEFRPQSEEDVQMARQQTDYINLIVREDNDGYLNFHSAFKDALVRKVGFFKWWWEEYDRVRGYTHTQISEQALMILIQDAKKNDGEVEILARSETEEGPIFDVEARRLESDGRARFASVPPEEVVWTPDARNFEDAGIVAHTREVTVDEVARVTGLDFDEIEEFIGRHEDPGSENLQWARQFHGGGGSASTSVVGGEEEVKPFSQRSVLLTEAYAYMDLDGDDISELRMFLCLGPDYEIVNGDNGEIVNNVPMAYITPDPEPHTIPGLCNWDNMKDIQEIKSQIHRGMLNSLAQAIEPQMEVVTGDVNLKDVLNPEISNIIRVRRPGMIREIRHTFIGGETVQALEYMNEVRADRGGMTRASEGLDPDALQSSTHEAVAATLDKAQQRIIIIARTFAETGVKRLYKGLLELVIENQDTERVVDLRGQFIPVDPRSWDVNTDVRISGALGSGSPADKIAFLSSILADQDQLLAAGSPLVTNVHIRATRQKILELGGFAGASEFYRRWGPEEEQQLQEKIANTPPPPDPAVMLLEVENLKVQMRAMEAREKLALDQQKAVWDDDFKRDKLARDSALKEAEIEAEFQTTIADLELKLRIAEDRLVQQVNESEE